MVNASLGARAWYTYYVSAINTVARGPVSGRVFRYWLLTTDYCPMQFPVPQFTDAEDKVIGPLTVKQFVIILAASACTFVAYSTTKDYYLTGAVGFFLGVPALILAFGQFNGRPVYASAIAMINYWTRPKFFIFRKEMETAVLEHVKDIEQQKPVAPTADAEDPRSRLKKIQYQLEQRAQQEADLLTRA